jgi:hypothetical protein
MLGMKHTDGQMYLPIMHTHGALRVFELSKPVLAPRSGEILISIGFALARYRAEYLPYKSHLDIVLSAVYKDSVLFCARAVRCGDSGWLHLVFRPVSAGSRLYNGTSCLTN